MEHKTKMRILGLFSILVAAASGQTPPVPYAPGTDGPGPTFSNSKVSLSFPGAYSSIRKVDFRNLKYPAFDAVGKPSGSLASGDVGDKGDEPDNNYSETLDAIYFLAGSRSSRANSALIIFD